MGDTLPDGHQKWFGNDNFRAVYFPDGTMPREYDWRVPGKGTTGRQGNGIGMKQTDDESRAGGTGSLKVGVKTPNAWGLHDMHGNVAEWCLDWHGPYESGPQTDPVGRADGDCRVFRGGFHSTAARFLRSANRGSWVPNSPAEQIGFRIVRGESPKGKALPPAEPPPNARNVSQAVPKQQPPAANEPFFEGPKPFVRIPDGAVGPVFISQNHSPSITECPNGDLLAVWFSTIGETDLTTSNAASRLRLGAKEWEPASPFWDAQDVNDHAPKIWWDGDRTLYHFVEARNHGDNLVRRSTDNGVTWTKAEAIRPRGEPAKNPIRLKDGVIAMPYDNASLLISRDNGRTWQSRGRDLRGTDDIRPGSSGPLIAGYHSPIVELADGRLLGFSRLDSVFLQARFSRRIPSNHSADLGETWQWGVSEFPVVSSVQKPAMLRLKEGPIMLCSFTDQWREWKDRAGLRFSGTGGEYTGFGLFAAVSLDEGKTWPHRRLLAPAGKPIADGYGYLAATETRDGRIQLITSQNHYSFNLAWIRELPPTPGRPTPGN